MNLKVTFHMRALGVRTGRRSHDKTKSPGKQPTVEKCYTARSGDAVWAKCRVSERYLQVIAKYRVLKMLAVLLTVMVIIVLVTMNVDSLF
jgi:hypothetical protein